MPRHRRGRRAVSFLAVLLLAVLTIGCGRHGIPSGDPAAGAGPVTALPTAATEDRASEPTTPTASHSAAIETPVASPAPTPTSAPTPLATPDLTAIERLLDDLDAALGDDAAAGTEEGSSK
jgi:hypothetical protein